MATTLWYFILSDVIYDKSGYIHESTQTRNKYWQYVFPQNHENVKNEIFFIMLHNVEFYHFFCGDNFVFAVWLMFGTKRDQGVKGSAVKLAILHHMQYSVRLWA